MEALVQIVVILLIHTVADFVLQSRKIAENKSKSLKWLLAHGASYTVFFTTCVILLGMPLWYGPVNGAIHTVVDGVTSRATSRLWAEGRAHDFFVVTGFDQWIHTTCLIVSASL